MVTATCFGQPQGVPDDTAIRCDNGCHILVHYLLIEARRVKLFHEFPATGPPGSNEISEGVIGTGEGKAFCLRNFNAFKGKVVSVARTSHYNREGIRSALGYLSSAQFYLDFGRNWH